MWILFLILILFPGWSFAGTCSSLTCVGSTPWMASDATYATVNHCVNACASRNGTVIVPSGSQTWSSILTITKGITLQGAGIGSTVINSSQSSIIDYEPDATAISNNERFDLSGFTFNGNGSGDRKSVV